MKAEDAFKRLMRCINVDHYIGTRDRQVIQEACKEKPVVAPKPKLKKKVVSED